MADIVVYGRGKTGMSLVKLAERRGLTAEMYDDEQGFDFSPDFCGKTVVVSPGVPPYAKGLIAARASGANVKSELDVCFPLCKGKVISVTGTNGKTTVCRLTNHILSRCGFVTHLLGNGGVPFSEEADLVHKDEIVVLESSSFQLGNAFCFAPEVSVFTNIAPDHIDYHGSFAAYILAKCNNFIRQKENQIAIFNADDKNLFTISQHANCRVMYYSSFNENADCYLDGDEIVLRFKGKKMSAKANIQNWFLHNKCNALAGVCAAVAVGADFFNAVSALAEYEFLPHRTEVFATVGNVQFVDDSKGTNVHATLAAVSCFDKTTALIVGGSDKGENFDNLFACLPDNVVYVAAVGQTAERMKESGSKFGVDVDVFENYTSAVGCSYDFLQKYGGGVVLLSNACASFDMFDGYARRGDYFKKIVKEMFCV